MAKEVEQSLTERANAQLATMTKDIAENYSGSDPQEAVAVMALSILEAETFEDMFLSAGVTPSSDLFDVGLLITDINFNRSSYEQGLPYYATFHGKKLSDGSEFIANCGGWQTVVVAYKLLKHNYLPRNMMFHRLERATEAGYHPINLTPWDGEEPF